MMQDIFLLKKEPLHFLLDLKTLSQGIVLCITEQQESYKYDHSCLEKIDKHVV